MLFEYARNTNLDSELRITLGQTSIVAVGPKTRASLEEFGMHATHVPKTHSSVGIGEIFSSIYDSNNCRVIIPRSAAANEFLRTLLEKIGLEVTEVNLYNVEPDGKGGDWEEFFKHVANGNISAIIFTSASAVRAFIKLVGSNIVQNTKLIAIGPFTSIELENADLVHKVSQIHTVTGALAEIMTD